MAVLTCPPGSQQRQEHKAFVCHFIFKCRAGTPDFPTGQQSPTECEGTLPDLSSPRSAFPGSLRQRASSS